jgi:hypothetical protein
MDQMKKYAIICIMFWVLAGCSWNSTIYVPEGDAVKLRETVKDVKVWVKVMDQSVLPGKMDLLDGWY